MKLQIIFLLIIVFIYSPSLLKAQIVELEWNTFQGGTGGDYGHGIDMDGSGNIYQVGECSATWGSPVNAYVGGDETYVACLNSSGSLLWNTFLGSAGTDIAFDIVVDNSGNSYVIGYSDATWGSPVNAYSALEDIFVAKLDSSGNLVWNTFLGTYNQEFGRGIALDGSGNVYITGYSYISWGTPVNAHSGGWDAFVAKLDSSGNLVWNTFMGCGVTDYGRRLNLDGSGNIYVTGESYGTWGTPVNAHSGNTDVFAAKLDSSGNRLWNTFMGSSSYEYYGDIAPDSTGNIIVTGRGSSTWGTPVNAFNAGADSFVASLNSSGSLLWNTFLGCASHDRCYGLVFDGEDNIYVTGDSNGTWGTPIHPYSNSYDAFVACFDSGGNRLWHTFLGDIDIDLGRDILRDSAGNIYVSGYSESSWGNPINPHSGGSYDGFVASLSTHPGAEIFANGSSGPVSITESDTLQIRVTLKAYGLTDNVDYWLAYKGPSGWIHYNNSTKKWETGLGVTHQGPLMNLNNKKVFQSSLAPGNYTFYFGVDMNMDGKVTKSSLYKDDVQIIVTSD